MSRAQQILLVVLRTVIGWHFLYEGYFKLVTPGWGPDGLPLRAWSSAGYLSGATGPLAGLFRAVGASSWIGAVDVLIPFALAAIGLGLMLGLFTQLACAGGMALLTLFYLAAIPTSGMPEPRLEGAYLLVNKTLIELAALSVVHAFRTGRIAGIDRVFAAPRQRPVLGEAAA